MHSELMNATQNTPTETTAAETRAIVQQIVDHFGYREMIPSEGLSTVRFIEQAIVAFGQAGTSIVPASVIERLRRIKRLLTHVTVVDAERKCTVYTSGMFGIRKTEVRQVKVELGPYAQYSEAVHVTYLEKGKRKARAMVEGYRPYFLVLEGWGHPDPAGMWEESSSAELKVSRYSACDPRWQDDFDAKIGSYLASGKARVLVDIRGAKGNAK